MPQDYFIEGTFLPSVNMKIMKMVSTGLTLRETKYIVLQFCCDEGPQILSHKAIRDRLANNRNYCSFCARKRQNKAAQERKRLAEKKEEEIKNHIPPPLWAIPPSTKDIIIKMFR